MREENEKKVERANKLALQIKNWEFLLGRSNQVQNFLLTLLTKDPNKKYGTGLKIQFNLEEGNRSVSGFVSDSDFVVSIHQAYQKHIDKLIGELAALEKELEDL